jgi:cell division septum initiation protein DivIVA
MDNLQMLEDFEKLSPDDRAAVLGSINDPNKKQMLTEYHSLNDDDRQGVLIGMRAKNQSISFPEDVTPEQYERSVEGVKTVLGDVLGAAGGAAGMALSAGNPALGAAGAGLGRGLGRGLIRYASDLASSAAPEDLTKSTIEDVKSGAEGFMLGESIGPAISKVLKPLGKGLRWVAGEGGEEAASKALVAHTSKGNIYAKNLRDARRLERKIPGLKFSRGAAANNPTLIQKEQILKKTTEGGADAWKEYVNNNDQAIGAYMTKNFGSSNVPKGLLQKAAQKEQALQKAASTATKEYQNAEDLALSATKEPQTTGAGIVEQLSKRRGEESKRIGAMFDALPNKTMESGALRDTVKAFLKDAEDNARELPSGITKLASKILKDTTGTEGSLASELEAQGFSKNLIDEIVGQAGEGGPSPVDLKKLRGWITTAGRNMKTDDANAFQASRDFRGRLLDQVEKNMSGVEGYQQARDQWKDYVSTFREGPVGKALRSGNQLGGRAINLSDVPRQFFQGDKRELASALIKATGDKQAASQLMDEYAAYDLAKGGSLNNIKLKNWLRRNKAPLEELGLYDKYSSLSSAKEAAEGAAGKVKDFQKTVASKMLGVDPEKAISEALSGKSGKSARQTVKDLLQLAGGDKDAVAGLQDAYANQLFNQAESAVKNISGGKSLRGNQLEKLIGKNKAAVRELFKDDPKKLKALRNVQKAYQTMARSEQPQAGGGSQTVEWGTGMLLRNLGRLAGGMKGSAIGEIVSAAVKGLSKKSQQDINKAVLRGMFDPEYATELINATKIKDINKMQSALESLGRKAAGQALILQNTGGNK